MKVNGHHEVSALKPCKSLGGKTQPDVHAMLDSGLEFGGDELSTSDLAAHIDWHLTLERRP